MTRTHRFALAAAALASLFAASGVTAQNRAPYTVVESGRTFARLQDAVNAIGDGSGTIRFASMRFADCAVQERGDILYTAAEPGQAELEGTICEGKGSLVLRGRGARVVGIVFANLRVGDGNAAGIRLEHGDLSVSQSWFRDVQDGILAGNDEAAKITVDKSTFTRAGTCEGAGGCAHSIYVGNYGSVTVTRSRFEAGRGGHYVKSRSPRTTVLGSSFDDSSGRGTNYMIDLSNGSIGRIAGNMFVQGKNKENHTTFIAVAAEGKVNSSNGLVIEGNTARMAPGVDWSSSFIADWSGDRLSIGTNALGAGLTRFDRR
jgi:hypothetical protein